MVPLERWNIDLAYEPGQGTGRMSMYTRFGAFCSGIADFDAAAMRIPQAEAAAMDPQQRLLLQASAEAMADAEGFTGRPVGTFTGKRVSCYMLCSDAGDCACLNVAKVGQDCWCCRPAGHCSMCVVGTQRAAGSWF